MEPVLTRVADYLWTQSWQIAILIAAVALATWALRNRSAHVRYLLWLLILAKCLTPPVVQVPLAVLPDRATAAIAPTIPASPPEEAVAIRPTQERPLPPSFPAAPLPPRLDTRQRLALGWLAGLAVFVCAAVIKVGRTNLWLRRERRTLPENVQNSIAETFRSLRVKRPPRVWLVAGVGQPFVWGLLRGDIYLPESFAQTGGAEHHRDILAHEISHVLRFDAAVNILQIVAQGIFWFHPLIWWANQRIRREREQCCDEMAIAHLGAKPKDYSTAIVSTLIQAQESIRPVPSLAVAGPVKNIEERIRAMLTPGKQFHRRPSLTVVAIVVLIALLAVPTTVVLSAKTESQPAAPSADQPAADRWGYQPRYTARTFNSKAAFDVFFIQDTHVRGWTWIGHTPSAAPLEIPACAIWGVRPSGPVKDWDLLVREIRRSKIPELLLMSATDSDLAQLADSTELQELEVRGGQITDAGLEHLKSVTGLQALHLFSAQQQITDAGLSHLKNLTSLERLSLGNKVTVTDASLEYLKGLTRLRGLWLTNCPITDEGLARLKDLSGLQDLMLWNTQITDAGLAHFKNLTALRFLYLHGTQFTDAGLAHLENLTALQELQLNADSQITDAGLEQLKGLAGLQSLQLLGTGVTDLGLAHLRSLAGLQELILGRTKITDSGLAQLKGLTKLRVLRIGGTQVTDAGLEHLKSLPALQRLGLRGTKVTDADLTRLATLRGLLEVRLDDTQVTDAGLASLKSLTSLQVLYLDRTRISDGGLAHLEGLTGLEELHLWSAKITDAGLEHLKGLTRLRDLDLDGTQVTDAGLEHLKALTRLRQLWLSKTQVTDAGVQRLQKKLPNLVIRRDETG